MRILFLGLNYSPDKLGIAPYNTKLCRFFRERGFDVHVVTTFPHYPDWRKRKEDRFSIFRRGHEDGVQVTRTYVYVPKRHSALKRILYDLSFTASSLMAFPSAFGSDIVYCVSPPLTLGLVAFLFSKIARSKFVLQVNDLIPDTVISVGLIKNRFVIALLYRLERFIYKHADLISLVSESMRKNVLQKGVDEGKVVVRTDFIDTSVMHPYADDNGFRRKYGFEGKFLVVHTGNMGQKQGLSVVLHAAALLRDERDIIFLLIGGGNDIENLKRLQQSKGLESVRFLEVQPEEDYPKILSAADICLLVQKKDVKDICFPGKLLAYMSCGRPIIAAVDSDSETAIQVKESDSGVVIEPEDPKLLAETLRSLKGNRVFLHKLGENGSKYIRDNFEQAAVLGRFFETFQRVVRDGE